MAQLDDALLGVMMRQRFRAPRIPAALAVLSTALVTMFATPALATPTAQPGSHGDRPAAVARPLPPAGARAGGTDSPAPAQDHRLAPAQLPPHRPSVAAPARPAEALAAASCTPADFSSRTGSALVSFLEAATTDCVNTLFGVTGPNASGVFRESQMLTVANAYQGLAAGYTGDNSKSVLQLVLFLRAGYYVQFYDSADVGSYDATLTNAVAAGLDAFVASPHLGDVSDANGQVAGETMVLTDSANLQGRYLGTYKQVLNAYNPATYNGSWYMVNFVNDVFTPLFRGHQNPDFVTAVTADPSIVNTLDGFALNHRDLLGTTNSFLDSNAGLETARFLEHTSFQATVRPLAKGLLNASAMTGVSAPLWVGVANLANYYDQAQCSYYGVCNLAHQLTAAVLTATRTCDGSHSILAQDLTGADLDAVCNSLQQQDPFFHNLVKDSGPIPGQYEASLQLVTFASRTDYVTYAGAIYDVDTNNGGITLIGDPATPGNQPISITYRDSGDDGFTARIWNLNHEYTHALDGRYDTKGTFSQQIAVPDVWWIEGVAEYVSYSYRGVTDTQAVAQAGNHTYALSTIFQNTYENSDVSRIYYWGYLAVRYMVERHPADIAAMLSHFRSGDYPGGYAVYNSLGTSYDADFNSWLTNCAAGACSSAGGPTAAFDTAVSGLTVQLTDRSTEAGSGSITGWAWTFGDGTGSSAASPSKTYAGPGSYTVTLTVTDTSGRTATASKQVTVASSGSAVPCTAADTRAMGQNCYRANQTATVGNLDYLYIYLPAGTTTLTAATTGGTGTAYLYYNPANWATPSAYTASSTSPGTTQSVTVTNTTAGYRYLSLYAQTGFSGVTVTTRY
ncbi:collagenase [Kitasatospora sp. NPDC002227]|uniref:collagenase n=1 Tax=Kitasatospora sp. NPDC002227 TaxID=3154773 RepID=UPI00331AEBC9